MTQRVISTDRVPQGMKALVQIQIESVDEVKK